METLSSETTGTMQRQANTISYTGHNNLTFYRPLSEKSMTNPINPSLSPKSMSVKSQRLNSIGSSSALPTSTRRK